MGQQVQASRTSTIPGQEIFWKDCLGKFLGSHKCPGPYWQILKGEKFKSLARRQADKEETSSEDEEAVVAEVGKEKDREVSEEKDRVVGEEKDNEVGRETIAGGHGGHAHGAGSRVLHAGEQPYFGPCYYRYT